MKERLLSCKHVKTIMHEWKIDLDTLSLCSTLYYPITENLIEKKEQVDAKKEDNNRILRAKK